MPAGPGYIHKQSYWLSVVVVVGTGNLNRDVYYDTQLPRQEWDYHYAFMDAPLERLPKLNYFERFENGWSWGGSYYRENSYYASVLFSDSIGSVRFGFSERQLEELRKEIWITKHSGMLTCYWDLRHGPSTIRIMFGTY